MDTLFITKACKLQVLLIVHVMQLKMLLYNPIAHFLFYSLFFSTKFSKFTLLIPTKYRYHIFTV